MGFRGKFKNRRDQSEPEVIKALVEAGCSVTPLDSPCDLVVGFAGRSHLVEVKTGKAKLTPTQTAWLAEWRGDYTVLRSQAEAEAFADGLRNAETPAKQGDSA